MKVHRQWYLTLIFGFILSVQGGNIALWREGASEPIRVFPYRAEMLPQEDQQRLQNGIRINSKADLIRLVEDYLS